MNSYEIQELRKDYLSRKDEYERFANLIYERLKCLVKNLEIHYYSIDFRITALCANNWVTVGAEYHSAITHTCTS